MSVDARKLDPTHYPESDDVGEHLLQRFIAELLRPLIERWLREQQRVAFTGADTFFYFAEGKPDRCRAPDVYVIEGVEQDVPEVGVWKTWEGRRPALAIEVVGDDWKKDYLDAPRDYAAMGAREVVIFDPWATARSRTRVRWQVFRPGPAGRLERVERSTGDRVRSTVLGAWIVQVEAQGHVRLRLGTDPGGEVLVPTAEELAGAMQRRAQAAEAEVERLRRELEALRRG